MTFITHKITCRLTPGPYKARFPDLVWDWLQWIVALIHESIEIVRMVK